MRLLLLNPNTSAAVTERWRRRRALGRGGGHQISRSRRRAACPSSPRAPRRRSPAPSRSKCSPNIAARYDAAIIAAFADPGLQGARELFDVPIVGLAEASMLTACMLGRRFSIVTFTSAMGPWFRECVEAHGLGGRCASIRMLDEPFMSLADVQEEKERQLVALANRAVIEDEADVVILAGAPLAGLAARVRHLVPVPLVEQMIAAVKQAETLIALVPAQGDARNLPPPLRQSELSLAPALASPHRP